MEEIKLSKKGNALIKLYEEMAAKGIDRVDGTRKEKVYNDFQLRKFRHICKHQISNEKIKTVLDYGSGAGIPGILLAIEHPNINFVIAESIQKKALQLEQLHQNDLLCESLPSLFQLTQMRIRCNFRQNIILQHF